MHIGLFWLIFLTPDLEMYCQILDFHLNSKSRKKKKQQIKEKQKTSKDRSQKTSKDKQNLLSAFFLDLPV